MKNGMIDLSNICDHIAGGFLLSVVVVVAVVVIVVILIRLL